MHMMCCVVLCYCRMMRRGKGRMDGDPKLSIIYKLIDRFLIIIDRRNRMISFEYEVSFVMFALLSHCLSCIHIIYVPHRSQFVSLSIFLLLCAVCVCIIFHNLCIMCQFEIHFLFISFKMPSIEGNQTGWKQADA